MPYRHEPDFGRLMEQTSDDMRMARFSGGPSCGLSLCEATEKAVFPAARGLMRNVAPVLGSLPGPGSFSAQSAGVSAGLFLFIENLEMQQSRV